MKKNLNCLFILLFLLLQGCGNSNNKSESGEKILVVDLDKTISLADLYPKAFVDNYTLLETSNESFIGSVKKVNIWNGQYLVADNSQNALYCFNQSGEFSFKIHSVGQGPNEYVNLSNISFWGDTIYLLDNYSSKILVYDKLGNFERMIKINTDYTDYWAMRAISDSTFMFLVTDIDDKLISIIDNKGEEVGQFVDKTTTFLERLSDLDESDFRINKKDDDFIISVPLDNNIYKFTSPDKFTGGYSFDFGKYNVAKFIENNTQLSPVDFWRNLEKVGYCNPRQKVDADSFVFCITEYKGGDIRFIFYDKKNGKVNTYSPDERSLGLFLLLSNCYYISGDDFVGVLYPEQILEFKVNLKDDKLIAPFVNKVKTGEENPILVHFSVKF